jgi:ABC-2 type transport system ATP-binding protein
MAEQALQALVTLAAEREITVLFSSHQIAEVEQIADRVCMIDRGRVVLNASLDELRSSYRRVQAVFEGKPPSAAFENAREEGRTLSLLVKRDVDAVVARAKSMQATSVEVAPVTLKEIFLEQTNGAAQ